VNFYLSRRFFENTAASQLRVVNFPAIFLNKAASLYFFLQFLKIQL
jgi:hypothetical protein